MPVKKHGGLPPTPNKQVLDDLVAEWRQQSESSGDEHAPVINIYVDERFGGLPTNQVYVVWDRWATVPADERSEIIMDAFVSVDEAAALQTTVAVGMTPDEWAARQIA